jgi:hypothetical protein
MFQDVHKLQEKLWPSDHFAVLLSMEVKRWQGQQRKVVWTWHSHIIHTYSHYVHENKESWQWLLRFCAQSPRKKISGR